MKPQQQKDSITKAPKAVIKSTKKSPKSWEIDFITPINRSLINKQNFFVFDLKFGPI